MKVYQVESFLFEDLKIIFPIQRFNNNQKLEI